MTDRSYDDADVKALADVIERAYKQTLTSDWEPDARRVLDHLTSPAGGNWAKRAAVLEWMQELSNELRDIGLHVAASEIDAKIKAARNE